MAVGASNRQAGPGGRVVATIVARNYVPYARVLGESVHVSNPGVERVTLLVDGTEADRATTGIGTVVLPADLGLPAAELEPMIVMYTVMELSTALKPALLRHLLRQGYEVAAYLDPDILVVGDLGGALDAARDHAIALTPHVLAPVPRDGLEIAERTVMQAGIFNLGFIAVGEGAGEFLDWWHARLTTDAVVDFAAGLFTDQRWVDWVPGLFPHAVLRNPGLNVAYWNAHERPLTEAGDGAVLAAGEPLVFFHFSGFQADRPWQLSRFTARLPRALVSESPTLARLCADYAARLEAAGYRDARRAEYGHGRLADGTVLTPGMRTTYRGALLGQLPFEAPTVLPLSTPGALREWFERPARLTPWYRLTPAQYARWLENPELQASDPFPLTHSVSELPAHLDARAGELFWAREAAAEAPSAGVPAGLGWTVLAGGCDDPSADAVEVADRLADALVAGGEQVDRVAIAARTLDRGVRWEGVGTPPSVGCPNVIVCVDANHVVEPELALQLEGCPGARVAVWLTSDPGEVERHRRYLEGFDEVWFVSPAIETVLRAVSPVRVARVDLPLRPALSGARRSGRGVRFLLELDAAAPLDRQEADIVVGAYRAAFEADAGHELLVQPRGGSFAPADLELVRHLAAGRADVRLGDAEPVPMEDVDVILALDPVLDTGIRAADAYASGRVVVTGVPGVAALVGVESGVVRVAAESGRRPSVAEVAEALVGVPALVADRGDARPGPVRSAGAASVVSLARGALHAERRPDRRDLEHRAGLEQEVVRLRVINAQHQRLRASLSAVGLLRLARAARWVYRVVRRPAR